MQLLTQLIIIEIAEWELVKCSNMQTFFISDKSMERVSLSVALKIEAIHRYVMYQISFMTQALMDVLRQKFSLVLQSENKNKQTRMPVNKQKHRENFNRY